MKTLLAVVGALVILAVAGAGYGVFAGVVDVSYSVSPKPSFSIAQHS